VAAAGPCGAPARECRRPGRPGGHRGTTGKLFPGLPDICRWWPGTLGRTGSAAGHTVGPAGPQADGHPGHRLRRRARAAHRDAWGAGHARTILAGRSEQAAASITAADDDAGLKPGSRKGIEAAVGYLKNKAAYLRYDLALDEGFPIATGITEGACRRLVKDRLDITGVRWDLSGAEALLKLGALRSNGDFDTYRSWQRSRRSPATTRPATATRSYPRPDRQNFMRSAPMPDPVPVHRRVDSSSVDIVSLVDLGLAGKQPVPPDVPAPSIDPFPEPDIPAVPVDPPTPVDETA
jgi:hypothetical protein